MSDKTSVYLQGDLRQGAFVGRLDAISGGRRAAFLVGRDQLGANEWAGEVKPVGLRGVTFEVLDTYGRVMGFVDDQQRVFQGPQYGESYLGRFEDGPRRLACPDGRVLIADGPNAYEALAAACLLTSAGRPAQTPGGLSGLIAGVLKDFTDGPSAAPSDSHAGNEPSPPDAGRSMDAGLRDSPRAPGTRARGIPTDLPEEVLRPGLMHRLFDPFKIGSHVHVRTLISDEGVGTVIAQSRNPYLPGGGTKLFPTYGILLADGRWVWMPGVSLTKISKAEFDAAIPDVRPTDEDE